MKFVFSILILSVINAVHGVLEVSTTIEGSGVNGYFGSRLASNSDHFVAVIAGTFGSANGQFQLYGRNEGGTNNWGFVKSLTESDSDGTGWMSAAKVDMSEDYLVFSDYLHDGVATGTGQLYIYSRNQGGTDNWGFVKNTAPAGLTANAGFGNTLTISGDTIAAGGDGMFKVWVFDKDHNGVVDSWGEVSSMQGDTSDVSEEYGKSHMVLRGDRLFVGAGSYQPSGSPTSNAWGGLYIYDRDYPTANDWSEFMVINPDLMNSNAAGTIVNGDYAFRTYDVSYDTNLIAFATKRDVDGITNAGIIQIIGKDVGGTDNWGIVTTFSSNTPAAQQKFGSKPIAFSLDDQFLYVTNIYTGVSEIEVRGRDVGGTDNWGFVETVDFSDSSTFKFAEHFALSGESLVVSEQSWTDSNGILKVGRVQIIAVPPCAASIECDTGSYCAAVNLKCAQKVCAVHGDCFGEFMSGRIPFCNTVSGFCEDKFAGTCSSVPTCTIAADKKISSLNSIGSITHSVTTTNTSTAREAVKTLTTDILSGTSITNEVYVFVNAEETAVFSSELFDNRDDATVLAHIKTLICADISEELCTISIPARRMLSDDARELTTSIIVSVTYEVDLAAFNTLQASSSFSEPSFIAALAAAAGVNVSDVIVNSATGAFTIDYIVTDEATGNDPLSEAALQAIADLEADIDTITAAVISALGLNSNDVSDAVVDKCGPRDCNGRGTCSASTGACTCTDINYWGINCETLVDCSTGEIIVMDGGAYCKCKYPQFGERCVDVKDCTACD